MWTKNQIEVLSSLRGFLKITNLYNKNGVYIGSVKIPDFLIFCLFSLHTLNFGILCIWGILEQEFNLKLISFHLGGAIGFPEITIIYIYLVQKTDLIVSTVDHFQEIVEKSK